jgi:Cu/Ag efflux protein CusF
MALLAKEEAMNKTIPYITAALLGVAAVSVGAQTKVIPREFKSVTVTVEAIDTAARYVTVRKADGQNETFYVPSAMKRFDSLKVGDKINATYYENVAIQVKQPGAPDANQSAGALVPVEGTPAGTSSYQRTITATITAIDPKVPSITITGPGNWKYSSLVKDKAALAKVKVGDKVDITWTMALLMSVE